jgi:hypothetical protein
MASASDTSRKALLGNIFVNTTKISENQLKMLPADSLVGK